ncbi:hypothetical protein LOZ66_004805 [Ophidiomyces ophidiicola]|nr:hypothetical protein LOZ66_004805 [Ophidiomyces ophidiicola]
MDTTEPSPPCRWIETLGSDSGCELTEWDDNATPLGSVNRCVHDIIHSQCLLQPEAAAVNSWDGEMSYGELDARSTNLAKRLTSKNHFEKGTFVSICMEKSLWTPVAMLGVMKAGGAFLLLDPAHPRDRLRQMLEDTSCALVLTSTACSQVVAQLGIEMIVLEGPVFSDGDDEEGSQIAAVSVDITPEDTMYAVFTSGSTGRPKGAIFSHTAYASSAVLLKAPLQIGPQSRVIQFSSYAFDVSISDHLLTLIGGGCICIPSESDRQNDLAGSMTRLGANWACITPSVARTLSPHKVPRLQNLVLTGEVVNRTDVDMWAAHVNLIGLYGPAEYAIGTTVNVHLGRSASATNIGRPYSAVCWMVDPLDHSKRLLPGADGELVIEGPAISRGYINNPNQTASSFISGPAETSHGQTARKMYKTGDLVRHNKKDGTFQFLGRKDTQVKLRGQRVELGEIEYHVRTCFPGTQEVVAEVVQFKDSTQQLVVFVFRPDSQEPTMQTASDGLLVFPNQSFLTQVPQLELALAQRLPKYMVPNLILRVARMPMTATGKTDRRRLREHVEQLSLQSLNVYHRGNALATEAPTTTSEKTLQILWAQVLGVPIEQIGRQSNFFHINGDSLQAMRLVSQAREAGLSMTVQDIFQHPRLCDLAETTNPLATEEQSDSTVAFEYLPDDPSVRERIIQLLTEKYSADSKVIEDIYPCTTTQKTLIMSSAMVQNNHTIAVECQLPVGLDQDRLLNAWKAVTRADPALRTHIVEASNGEYFQVVLSGDTPLETTSDMPTAVQGKSPVDIWGFQRPLARLIKHEDRLTMLIHHTICDGYSVPVIFQHLAKAYSGEALLPRPFGPFLRWLQRSEAPDVDDFWRHKFADFEGKTFPPPLESLASGQMPMAISVLEPRLVLDLPDKTMTSTFSIESRCRLALAIVLSISTDVADVSFGAVASRRGAPVHGIADMTGPTATALPVRVQLKPEDTLWANLKHVQDQALQASEFECAELHHIGQLSPSAGAVCYFQTCLVVQPDPSTAVPQMFSQWSQFFERDVYPWGLCFECVLSQTSVEIVASYDERMVDGDRVRSLREQFAEIWTWEYSVSVNNWREVVGLDENHVDEVMVGTQIIPNRVRGKHGAESGLLITKHLRLSQLPRPVVSPLNDAGIFEAYTE